MKRPWLIPLAVLTAILAFCLWNSAAMTSHTNRWRAQVAQADKLARAEDFSGAAEALEFHVRANSPLVGIPLQDLHLKDNLLVCSISRQGKSFIPRGPDAMHAGDSVIVVTTNTGLNDLNDILR